ncbi:MAG: ABC transporter permease, partial [Clostridia bacterium]|nr:ABC transporter permease [Clostridia bacterium]
MKYNIMSYLVGEGFRNVLKNKKSTSAALTIMCMAMFMFGIFFVLGENINYVMTQVQSEQGFKVFLYKDVTDTEIADIEAKIRAIDGTNTVEYVSKSQGWNEFLESSGDLAERLSDGYGSDDFPDSFVITLTDLELNDQVQQEIKKIDRVEDIQSSDDTISMLVSIAKGLRMVTLVILIILVFISIFIITNTIKLTVHARRKEISIMKYVGATNGFIRWPFIVEGIIIGLVSALITVFIVGLIYNLTTNNMIQTETFKKLGLKLYTFSDMFN